jgi:hypothetical protein
MALPPRYIGTTPTASKSNLALDLKNEEGLIKAHRCALTT